MEEIVLSDTTPSKNIYFRPERPYCQLISIVAEDESDDYNDYRYSIEYDITYYDGGSNIGNFTPVFSEGIKKSRGNLPKLALDNAKSLKLTITSKSSRGDKKTEFTTKFIVKYDLIDRLSTDIPTNGFDTHLNNSKNTRILFSAPFGQGKTTFINEFFKERTNKYRVFKLFPVNYSVASNQDIFKYVKVELLCQLLERDFQFKKESISHATAIKGFGKKNIHKILGAFLLAIPHIGRSSFQMFKELDKLKETYLKEFENGQIDEEKEAFEFLTSVTQQSGSPFEDDFYTQLIRDALKAYKIDDPNKENVLIIEDIDRIDPEHIFRLLNVFSAHFDNFSVSPSEDHNKFGFDKIILVCDLDNIRKIYAHKYGATTDFGGYINKYYSTEPFIYDNRHVYDVILNNIDLNSQQTELLHSPMYNFFYHIIWAFVNVNCLSLRDLLNIQAIKLKNQRLELHSQEDLKMYLFNHSASTPTLHVLNKLLGKVELLRVINTLESKHFKQKFLKVLDTNCAQLVLGLHESIEDDVRYTFLSREKEKLEFHIQYDNNNNYVYASNIFVTGLNSPEKKLYIFDIIEFKAFMIENVKRLKD